MNRYVSKLIVPLSLWITSTLSSCAVGSPPGFSEGNLWSAPIVNPLENGLLIVPVMFKDKGPYLFSVDLDSQFSSIDRGIAAEVSLRGGFNGTLPDERDRKVPVYYAEVESITVGNLTVRNKALHVHKMGTFWNEGREIRGLLGKDILADSLISQFNRDDGLLQIATQGNLPSPGVGQDFGYFEEVGDFYRRVAPRRVVTAQVNGTPTKVHFDMGSRTSTLRTKTAVALGGVATEVQGVWVDDLGTNHPIKKAARVDSVSFAGVEKRDVLLIDYPDKRFAENEMKGSIGMDILSALNIWYHPHKGRIHVWPRQALSVATAERIRRWPSFGACAETGCATIAVSGSDEAPVLNVSRDPAAPAGAYGVVLGSLKTPGPYVYVTIPEGKNEVSWPISPIFSPGELAVLDVAPFPRQCVTTAIGDERCIFEE